MSKIIDLSLPLQDGMITYPPSYHQRFESAILGRIAIEGRETRKFTMGSHCGTHIDAMKHFLKNGKSIDQLPIENLVGVAQLVNLGKLAPGTVIEADFLKSLLPDKKIDRLVLRTDWSRFFNTAQYYQNWPYLSQECTQMLVELEIKLLAIDFPSPDSVYYGDNCSLDCPNHKTLFSKEIILVEYLYNLKRLPSGDIYFIALPLKLIDFDGAPARVVAYSI